MGFWQGMAKAVGEISEENFTRRERQKDRDLQTQRDSDAFEREKQLAAYRSKLETQQALLLAGIKKTRGKTDSSTEDYVGASTFLSQRVSGVEGADSFISTLKKDPSLAPDAVELIADIEKSRGASLTPQEILEYIVLIPGAKGETKVISLLDEEYEVEGPGVSSFVGAGSGAYDKPSDGDITRAEKQFQATMIEKAQTELDALAAQGMDTNSGGKFAEIQEMLSGLTDSDETTQLMAERKLFQMYGEGAVPEFNALMQDNPYLRAIYRSSAYSRLFMSQPSIEEVQTVPFREKLKTVADNWDSLSKDRQQEILREYPEIKDFLNE